MMVKRVRQFLQNISYGFQAVDQMFLIRYLNEKEMDLFGKLQRSEQIHAILVAKGVLQELDSTENGSFLKAVLFHDIGKIRRPLNIVEKSLAVMVDKLFQERSLFEKFEFMRSFRHHGPWGEEILRKEDVFKEPLFYDLVGTHQETQEEIAARKNEELEFYHNLLKKYDERY
ncbi:HD domain-containing protein [Proteiniclasticum sp. C24MP]|uniref:HD domain-containing protein n=1 Tax=Proteiniclasticum sp. C24MP TaxID=3374101 RepID=UPI0037551882